MHIAIIAEYNPFHKGHAYQIDTLRRNFGDDARISIILGGIFSQRGEPYVSTPYIRANAALSSGADLVLEMPFPFSCAPASIFARAGVEIAKSIGADILAFGSECGDTEKLTAIQEKLDSKEFAAAISKKKRESDTLGRTRVCSETFKELFGDIFETDKPNDILAIEYIRAIKSLGAKIKPYAILRRGDYKSGEGEFASATSLRRDYAAGGIDAIKHGIPDSAFEIFSDAQKCGLLFPDFDRLSSAALLKLAENTGPSSLAFSSSGIIGRLKSAAKKSSSITELLTHSATKRYTDAELSRALLYTLFSVSKSELDEPVYYTRLLAANKRGREVLSGINIELITKPSDTKDLSAKAVAQYERTFIAERAYALTLDGKYEHKCMTPKVLD